MSAEFFPHIHETHENEESSAVPTRVVARFGRYLSKRMKTKNCRRSAGLLPCPHDASCWLPRDESRDHQRRECKLTRLPP